MTPPIRLDRERLTNSAAALAHAGRPVRISSLLLGLWCGSQPTEELRARLLERGCEIVPAADYGGGWDVRVTASEKEFTLR